MATLGAVLVCGLTLAVFVVVLHTYVGLFGFLGYFLVPSFEAVWAGVSAVAHGLGAAAGALAEAAGEALSGGLGD